jgi:hypothetical protein
MHMDLELTTGDDGGLCGSALWPGPPRPERFAGVLELLELVALLGTAPRTEEIP